MGQEVLGEKGIGVSKGEFGLVVGAEMEAVSEIELGGRLRPPGSDPLTSSIKDLLTGS